MSWPVLASLHVFRIMQKSHLSSLLHMFYDRANWQFCAPKRMLKVFAYNKGIVDPDQ